MAGVQARSAVHGGNQSTEPGAVEHAQAGKRTVTLQDLGQVSRIYCMDSLSAHAVEVVKETWETGGKKVALYYVGGEQVGYRYWEPCDAVEKLDRD